MKKTIIRITIGIGIVLAFAIVALSVFGYMSQRPLSEQEAITYLDQYFNKMESDINHDDDKKPRFSGAQVLVSSSDGHIILNKAIGEGKGAGNLTVNTPFHIASVGKMMTAATVYMLIDEKKISYDTKISTILPKDKMDSLFVVNGQDFANEVTLGQLLSHTSGVADYFSDGVTSGDTLAQMMAQDINYTWTPEELLQISQNRQGAFGKPGTYHYSDTGYVLLGFIIETIEEKSVEQVFEERIFSPLNMKNTYMALRSKPLSINVQPMADLWLNEMDLANTPALSVDWTGGGLISTLDDLFKFSKALHGSQLISKASYDKMFEGINQFEQGIYTGSGGMVVKFKEFFPLLDLPLTRGHIGILSTHVFYDPSTDTHIIMNFGSDQKMTDSFMALIEILSILKRIE